MKYLDQQLTFEGKLRTVAQVYVDNFVTFLLISALVWIPSTVIGLTFFGAGAAAAFSQHTGAAIGLVLLPLLPIAIALCVQSWAVNVAIAQACLDERPTVSSAYAGALRKIGNLFVVSLVYGLIVGLGTLLFIIPGVVLFLRYAYAPGIVIVENASPMDALRRSAKLSEGRKASLFGTLLVVGIITAIIAKIWGAVVGGLPGVGGIASALPQLLFGPVAPIVVMLDYLTARTLHEDAPAQAAV